MGTLLSVWISPGLCDRVIMKDGRILEGSVINSTGTLLIVKLETGETKPIPREMIRSWSSVKPGLNGAGGRTRGVAADEAVLLARTEYKTRILQEISSAKRCIRVIMYEMHLMEVKGNPPRLIANALIDAVKRGVDVRVLFEDPGEGFILDCNTEAAEYLSSGGVRVKFDDPGRVTHTKLVILDGETCILGSHNWSASGLRTNSESSVLVRSRPVAEEFSRHFMDAWAKGNGITGVCERQRRREVRLSAD